MTNKITVDLESTTMVVVKDAVRQIKEHEETLRARLADLRTAQAGIERARLEVEAALSLLRDSAPRLGFPRSDPKEAEQP
jgi:hypothetical protein